MVKVKVKSFRKKCMQINRTIACSFYLKFAKISCNVKLIFTKLLFLLFFC